MFLSYVCVCVCVCAYLVVYESRFHDVNISSELGNNNKYLNKHTHTQRERNILSYQASIEDVDIKLIRNPEYICWQSHSGMRVAVEKKTA